MPTETGFRIVIDEDITSRLIEDYIAQKRVAAINNLTTDQLNEAEVRQLMSELATSRRDEERWVTRTLAQKYLGVTSQAPVRLQSERSQQFKQRVESWLGIPANLHSYGWSIPSYLPALREMQQTDGVHKAALVGAIAPDTVTEFAATVNTVFPQNKCTLIDIAGIDTRTASSDVEFVEGDALKLASLIAGFDSIHTNLLFLGASNQNAELHITMQQRSRFFEQAHTVLNPGGRLIMIECMRDSDNVKKELSDTGFRMVEIEPAEDFNHRKAMDRFIYHGMQKLDRKDTYVNPYSDLIVAEK